MSGTARSTIRTATCCYAPASHTFGSFDFHCVVQHDSEFFMTIKDRYCADTASHMYIYIHDNITTGYESGGWADRSGSGGSSGTWCAIMAAAALMAVAGTARATSIMAEVGVTQMQRMIPGLTCRHRWWCFRTFQTCRESPSWSVSGWVLNKHRRKRHPEPD